MKTWGVLILETLGLVGIVSTLWGQRVEFSYDSQGRRDPFVPLDIESAPVSPTEFRVEGIIHDPIKGSLAIINGKVLNEGDSIGIYKVERIDRTKVILSKEEETVVLRLAGKPKEEEFELG